MKASPFQVTTLILFVFLSLQTFALPPSGKLIRLLQDYKLTEEITDRMELDYPRSSKKPIEQLFDQLDAIEGFSQSEISFKSWKNAFMSVANENRFETRIQKVDVLTRYLSLSSHEPLLTAQIVENILKVEQSSAEWVALSTFLADVTYTYESGSETLRGALRKHLLTAPLNIKMRLYFSRFEEREN